jgi:O-antigen ligase
LTPRHGAPWAAAAGPFSGGDSVVHDLGLGRSLLFVGSLLLGWVSVSPFASLSDARWLDPNNASDVLNQAAYLILGSCAAVFLMRRPQFARLLLRPAYGFMLAWLLVSVATSDQPLLSARRLIFMTFVVLLGAVTPLLPRDRRHFCDLIGGVTVAVLVLCYVGVALAPDLAVHQATDLVEPRLAGNWRGIFSHKNIAGEMMGIFVFVGIYVAAVRSAAAGWSIIVAAVVFLVFTEAKAAVAFLPLILALVWTARGGWALGLRLGLFFATLIALSVITIGSLSSPVIKSVVDQTLSDPTFTGRTEIWQLAIDWFWKRPLFGFGYGAFWQTDQVMYFTPLNEDGAALADHAHNAVLNLGVTTGVPGVLLALVWAVVLPCRDFARCLRAGADVATTNLFLRIWAFAIANCAFESILFGRGDPMWFTMLMAMFGLRFLSVCRLGDDSGPSFAE